MSIHVALKHRPASLYDRPVSMGPQVIRLRPAPHCRTPILSYSIKIHPEEKFVNWQQDPFSNYHCRVVIPEKTQKFEVEVEVVAQMAVYNPFDFFLEPNAEKFPLPTKRSSSMTSRPTSSARRRDRSSTLISKRSPRANSARLISSSPSTSWCKAT
ncbi:MAG: transglutaminase N-terminal domain-containing protein [Chthoniobacteraceae bacterium]